MEKTLYFLPEFNAFGIADNEQADCKQEISAIKLSNECYKKLDMFPPIGAPKVGFLLGREEGYYTIDHNYAYAAVKSGVEPVFLDYQNYERQLKGCSGLILPGGSFQSPEWYYRDPSPFINTEKYPNARSEAYAKSLHTALDMGIPVLGICAGAQVIAAEFGAKLRPNTSAVSTGINHQSEEKRAHWVNILKDTPLYDVLGVSALMTNSRHKETISGLFALTCYAKSQDGVLEAWGSLKDKVLGIQWHPEDYAATGNALHQKVYDWLANEARKYQATQC